MNPRSGLRSASVSDEGVPVGELLMEAPQVLRPVFLIPWRKDGQQ